MNFPKNEEAGKTGGLKMDLQMFVSNKVPGVVKSRINIANGRTKFTPIRPKTGESVSAGWKKVVDGHFVVPLGNSRSVFSVSQGELKTVLQSKQIANSPVTAIKGGQYKRVVDTGKIIGNTALKHGGNETTWIEVFTDSKGNFISTYPVPAPK